MKESYVFAWRVFDKNQEKNRTLKYYLQKWKRQQYDTKLCQRWFNTVYLYLFSQIWAAPYTSGFCKKMRYRQKGKPKPFKIIFRSENIYNFRCSSDYKFLLSLKLKSELTKLFCLNLNRNWIAAYEKRNNRQYAANSEL